MLNPTQALILGTLHSGRKPGARVHEVALTARLYWRLTRSQLYRELDRMTETGLLVLIPADPEHKSRTGDEFEASPIGRQMYAEWSHQFTPASLKTGKGLPVEDQLRNPWILRLMLAGHDGYNRRDICLQAAEYYRTQAHLGQGVHEMLFGADLYHSYQTNLAKWFESMAEQLA